MMALYVGMSIILNSYCTACKALIPTFMATNSVLNTYFSMLDYFWECQLISDMFMKSMNPVLDFLVYLTELGFIST